MARWEALQKAYLNFANGPRLVKRGEQFEYGGWPSSVLEPLDSEAEEVKAFHDRTRASGQQLPPSVAVWRASNADVDSDGDVDIPKDWRKATPQKRIAIARKLGAKIGINAHGADEMIEQEVKKRGAAAAADKEG